MLCKKRALFRHNEETFLKKASGDENNSPDGIVIIGFRQ